MLGPCKDMPCGLVQLNGLKQGLDSDLGSSPDIIRSNILFSHPKPSFLIYKIEWCCVLEVSGFGGNL